jgi:hypothetical protein
LAQYWGSYGGQGRVWLEGVRVSCHPTLVQSLSLIPGIVESWHQGLSTDVLGCVGGRFLVNVAAFKVDCFQHILTLAGAPGHCDISKIL